MKVTLRSNDKEKKTRSSIEWKHYKPKKYAVYNHSESLLCIYKYQ